MKEGEPEKKNHLWWHAWVIIQGRQTERGGRQCSGRDHRQSNDYDDDDDTIEDKKGKKQGWRLIASDENDDDNHDGR